MQISHVATTKTKEPLNWRKIDDNWKSFVNANMLESKRSENNYFFGKQEFCKAKEIFQGFEILYENKFNKSTEYGSSFKIGHSFTIVSPIELLEKLRLTVERNSGWKRLFKRKKKLKIELSDNHFFELLPLKEFDTIASFFPDIKLAIKQFDEYQNEKIEFGQVVLSIKTSFPPSELEHL